MILGRLSGTQKKDISNRTSTAAATNGRVKKKKARSRNKCTKILRATQKSKYLNELIFQSFHLYLESQSRLSFSVYRRSVAQAFQSHGNVNCSLQAVPNLRKVLTKTLNDKKWGKNRASKVRKRLQWNILKV